MRFGAPLLTKQVLTAAMVVSACFSMASAKTGKRPMKKPAPVVAVADNDNELADAQMETPEDRARLSDRPSQGTLRRKLRKYVTDQQPSLEERLATPLQSDSVTPDSLKSDSKFVSGALSFGRSTSLYDFHDGTRKDSNDTSLKLDLNLWPYDYSLRIAGGYSQDLRDSESSDFGDTSISLRHSAYRLTDTLSWSPSLTGIAPTSKSSSRLNNMTGAARLGASLGYTSTRVVGLTAGASLSGGKNFNQYDTALNGAVLTEYALNQAVNAAYNYGRFGFSVEFIHKNGWTYQGNLKESFEHTEELGVELTKMFVFALGHTNGGSALKPNGVDSNVQIVDENNSMVYASLTMVF